MGYYEYFSPNDEYCDVRSHRLARVGWWEFNLL